jgi:hypothetical protein
MLPHGHRAYLGAAHLPFYPDGDITVPSELQGYRRSTYDKHHGGVSTLGRGAHLCLLLRYLQCLLVIK